MPAMGSHKTLSVNPTREARAAECSESCPKSRDNRISATSALPKPSSKKAPLVAALHTVDQRWAGQDSNLRRLCQRIYSPPPLPLGTPTHDALLLKSRGLRQQPATLSR